MNILVTGGLGFIGSHIVVALLKKGHFVRMLDNLDRKMMFTHNFNNFSFLSGNVRKNVELIIGDIRDFNICVGTCSDIDVVLHNAAISNLRRTFEKPEEAYEVNVIGTYNLLKAAKESGVKRFIFSSSAKIYGNTEKLPSLEEDRPNLTSPYAFTKCKAENYCKRFSEKYGLNVISLRYFSVYGPRQSLEYGLIGEVIRGTLNGGYLSLYASEEMERDFTYIDDVVEANLLCLEYTGSGYEVFNIGGGESYFLEELVRLASKILKKEIELEYKRILEGTVIKTHADISKAQRVLCYYPKVSLEEGLRYTINWIKEKDYLISPSNIENKEI